MEYILYFIIGLVIWFVVAWLPQLTLPTAKKLSLGNTIKGEKVWNFISAIK